MSIFGMMGTAITGLNAQANKLSTISDNISNSNTTGYKNANEAFETVLGDQTPGTYSSGGVQSVTNYAIASQGNLSASTSVTNMGITGNGFFIVTSAVGATGTQALTRAGDFVPDANGNLVNTAGYYLMGYDLTSKTPSVLSVVNTAPQSLSFKPSTKATYAANLPSSASIVPDPNATTSQETAGANQADSTYTEKASITAYDQLGTPVNLDVYTTKTAANTWEVSVYNSADASSTGGFPYTSSSVTEPLQTQTVTFDPTTGDPLSGTAMTFSLPNANNASAGQTISLDLSGLTQVSAAYSPVTNSADGYSPTKLSSVSIADDGTLSYNYANGTQLAKYKIPLGNVASPDSLTSESGNVYQLNGNTGTLSVGTAKTNGLGKISSGELESSTVDIATELANMIQAQQSYQANSKVLQTASDLLSVINNLK